MKARQFRGLDVRAQFARTPFVLHERTVVDRDGITIRDVSCREAPRRGQSAEPARVHALVFVRRGCFARFVDGDESLFDPTVAYCTNPGEEESFDHPHADGDECTAISVDPSLVASLWGSEETLPSGPLPTSPQLDLEHRLLLAGGRRGADADELVESAITTAARALELVDSRCVASGRPATTRARNRTVSGAREALAADATLSLTQLARQLAVSPHHLSRIFHSATGHTISRHRMRLRARTALERLADGERHLARLAADLGLADQSHLCRVLRTETGAPPSELRALLEADSRL
jgi:AraC-like DNA-binding protein